MMTIMATILFTHSYFYRFDPKQWKTGQPYPPYGTLMAAATMREAGYEVDLHDNNLRHSAEELRPKLQAYKPRYLVIYDDGFNYLTKMCLTNMRQAAFDMAKMGKEHGAKVIVCSSDSTDQYESYLAEGVDYVVLGEGEITLLHLINALEDGQEDFSEMRGLTYRQNGQTIHTGKRPVLKDLDSLPDPAWDLVDMEPYKDIWYNKHGYFTLNLATTRGCPFKCNWCAKPIYGNRYNVRSPQRVVNEIKMLMEQYDVRHFWMADDIFGLKPNWVQEFRDLVVKEDLDFSYQIQSRVDLMLKGDTIDALVESGLSEVWVGAESGSQKILDAMDKGTQVEQIYEATKKLQDKGVRVAFFLQFGYLGETKDDIRQTIRMMLDCMPDNIGVSVSYPLPGTGFYEKVKAQLGEKANWTDSDELAMMYRGTFSPEYYKKLHRYVHKVYRRKQALQQMKQVARNPAKLRNGAARRILSLAYYAPMAHVDRLQLAQLEKQQA